MTLSMALIGHALALIGRAQKPRLILAQKASLSLSSISCQPASFETGSKGNIDPVTNILLSFFSYLATHTLCAMYTARRGGGVKDATRSLAALARSSLWLVGTAYNRKSCSWEVRQKCPFGDWQEFMEHQQ